MIDELRLLKDQADAYSEHALWLRLYGADPQAALGTYAYTLTLYVELGDQDAQAQTLLDMAEMCEEDGDHAAAHRYVQQILPLYNNRPAWTRRFVFFRLKNLSLKQGHLCSALGELKQLLESHDPDEAPKGRVNILIEMAKIAEQAVDIPASRNYFAEAAFLSEQPNVDSTTAAWEWGQMEYRQGNKREGYTLCRYALWLDQTGLEDQAMDESQAYMGYRVRKQTLIANRQQFLAAIFLENSMLQE